MPWRICVWTNESIDHIAQHGVTQDEFEAVISDPEREGWTRETGRRFAEAMVAGRWLFCIYNEIDETYIEPVTAFEVER